MKKVELMICAPLLQKKRGGVFGTLKLYIIWGELRDFLAFARLCVFQDEGYYIFSATKALSC
jgi:hypothetical protein